MSQNPDMIVPEKAIGERIRKLRINRQLSNVQLADALGLSVPAVKKIQHGSACIQFQKLAEICRVLESDPNHVLGFENKMRDRLAAVAETLLEAVGVPRESTNDLVSVVLESTFATPVVSGVDPLQAARVPVYLAARRAMGTTER